LPALCLGEEQQGQSEGVCVLENAVHLRECVLENAVQKTPMQLTPMQLTPLQLTPTMMRHALESQAAQVRTQR
jgi:hypothetical protein